MKQIYQLAKSLNDADLSTLVEKLNSLLDNRKKVAIEKDRKDAEMKAAAQTAIQGINEILATTGVTLGQLGLVREVPTDVSLKSARKTTIIKAENQTYILVDGQPQLVFSVTAGRHRKDGTAVEFSQLTPEQQLIAKAAVDARNARRV